MGSKGVLLSSGVSLGEQTASERQAINVNLPRFTSQATHFEQQLGDDPEHLGDSMSGLSSSSYNSQDNTDSQDSIVVQEQDICQRISIQGTPEIGGDFETSPGHIMRVIQPNINVPKYKSVAPVSEPQSQNPTPN